MGAGSGGTIGRMGPELLRFGWSIGLDSAESCRKVEEEDITAMKDVLPKPCC